MTVPCQKIPALSLYTIVSLLNHDGFLSLLQVSQRFRELHLQIDHHVFDAVPVGEDVGGASGADPLTLEAGRGVPICTLMQEDSRPQLQPSCRRSNHRSLDQPNPG